MAVLCFDTWIRNMFSCHQSFSHSYVDLYSSRRMICARGAAKKGDCHKFVHGMRQKNPVLWNFDPRCLVPEVFPLEQFTDDIYSIAHSVPSIWWTCWGGRIFPLRSRQQARGRRTKNPLKNRKPYCIIQSSLVIINCWKGARNVH